MKQLFEEEFPPTQAVWVEGFLTVMVELRRLFGNDIDKAIILAAIGQQMLLDAMMPPMPHAETQKGPFPDWKGKTTNIDALSRAMGIPRESVRRKINELMADGLVERTSTGGLMVASGTAGRMAASTNVAINMLDRLVATYMGMLAARGRLPPPASR